MSLELRIAGAAVLGLALTLALTPLAIRAARRTGFVDLPSGWKTHEGATPYLGGVAVVLAAAGGAAAFTDDWSAIGPVTAGAGLLLAVGIVDDRVQLHAGPRLIVEAGAAALLWWADLGWELGPEWLDLALTVAWVIVVVNALNLLDLMDGVAASTAGVAAAGIALLAAIDGDVSVAVLASALAASCGGFLVFNLASPSRVFLGDAGTMAIGFMIAALAIAAVADHTSDAAASLAAAACLFGVPLLDTASRVVLRLSRGISLMTAGPDSMANRLHDRLGSARRVSLVAASAQAVLSAAAIAGLMDGAAASQIVFAVALAAGAACAYSLQAGSPRPPGVTGG